MWRKENHHFFKLNFMSTKFFNIFSLVSVLHLIDRCRLSSFISFFLYFDSSPLWFSTPEANRPRDQQHFLCHFMKVILLHYLNNLLTENNVNVTVIGILVVCSSSFRCFSFYLALFLFIYFSSPISHHSKPLCMCLTSSFLESIKFLVGRKSFELFLSFYLCHFFY